MSYGTANGARAVEQLKQVVIELKMVPIRSAIHIPNEIYRAVVNESVPVNPELFKLLRDPVDRVGLFLDDLIWTARALKTAREN